MPTDKDLTFDTRVADASLLGALEKIRDSLDTATVERKVEIGSVLWQLGNAVRDVLESIKKDVRAEAVSRLKGHAGHTVLEGEDLGAATITIPEATLRVPKGTTFDGLKQVLGSDFSLFFEEVVSMRPREEFEARVTALTNPLHRQVLHGAVERVEPTPRVSFKRRRPSKKE